MSNRKESKMLGIQRKSAKLASIVSVAILSVGFTATSALSTSADGRPAPKSAANKQFGLWTLHRHTIGRNPRYFGYAAPGSVFVPVEVHPMTVAISRARAVQTICPTERSPDKNRSPTCPSR